MLIGGKRAIFKVVISALLCTTLTGQTEPPKTLTSSTTTNNKNTTSNVTSLPPSNKITSPTTTAKVASQDYFLSNTDGRNIIIVTMTVATMGILCNAAVVLVIIIDPLKILRRGSWITIFNLAIADFLASISCFFVWGASFFGMNMNWQYIASFQFGWAFGVSGSFIFLTFLTVQIYFITKFPLKSRFMFTTTKVSLATTAIWLFASLLGLSNITFLHFTPDNCYRIHIARMCVLEIAVCTQVLLNLQVSVEIMKSRRRSVESRSYQINRHRSIAKTVIILTLILFFTAFPYFVFRQIEYCSRLGYFGAGKTAEILSYLSYCYAPIAILNFSANPILYALRLPDYRQTLLAFVGKAKGRAVTPSKTLLKTSTTQTNTFSMHKQGEARGARSGAGHQIKQSETNT